MVEVRLFDRLRALTHRRRWVIGITTTARCRRVVATLLGVEGSGLAIRPEIFAVHAAQIPVEIRRLCRRLHHRRPQSPVDAAFISAQLAERQAILLDEFAALIAPVWDRVMAVAVDDSGIWRCARGLIGHVGLCDAARLAELSGQNVIDAFADRDLAVDGRGRPLEPIPYWLLLHDLQKTRVLVQLGRRIRITLLPDSRDASGASRIVALKWGLRPVVENYPPEQHARILAESIAGRIASDLPQIPAIHEIVLAGAARVRTEVAGSLPSVLPRTHILDLAQVGITPQALRPASVGLLGLLHLDQTPANVTALTGARCPRVLGRLTPGSLPNWHRLVRALAEARPSVVTLRSAM